jgi:hypothetical protein
VTGWVTRRTRGIDGPERGSIAVLAALLSVVIFTSAALAVDLGSAWSSKREVQRQADVAALSSGYLLPMNLLNRQQIADTVAARLSDNSTLWQAGAVSGSTLLNGQMSDGEVTFHHDSGLPCVVDCTQMRVVAPEAEVPMIFSRVIGIEGAAVQREATVRAVGALPDPSGVLPFWLPSGCALGSAEADTVGGTSGGSGPPSPTATPSGTATSSPTPGPLSLPVGTHQISGLSLSVVPGMPRLVTGLTLTSISHQVDRASIRFYSPDMTRYVDYAAMDLKNPASTLTVAAFQISNEITDTLGTWRIYAVVERQKTVEISSSFVTVTVGAGVPTAVPTLPTDSPTVEPSGIPVGCVGQDRGNFGQLDSPRAGYGSGSQQMRLAANIAEGLDHQLVPFVFPPSQAVSKVCNASANTFIGGAAPDNVVEDGRNCITGDTGNDGPALYDGLVAGVNGYAGRLSVARQDGETRCPGRLNRVIDASTINDDVLSCFLRNGATLEDLAQEDGVNERMLDPSIVDSPRLVWLPVVYATDRAQKGFQPIMEFVPGFITDETQTSGATPDNGVVVQGSSVSKLTIFCFNKEALPVDARSGTVSYNVNLRSIVRLVD